MAEASQSAMRIVGLIFFTTVFAGAWANDRPREQMALKEMPKPTAVLSKEETTPEMQPVVEIRQQAVAIKVPAPVEVPSPPLEAIDPAALDMTLTVSIESEGLSIAESTIRRHIHELPLGIANGDYLMVDPEGGVGWVRIRGQQQRDLGNTMLATTVDKEVVRYLRVSPLNAVEPLQRPVPTPLQYATEEFKTIR